MTDKPLKQSINSPQSLLENAKSVICYGIQIPKGIIYANTDHLALYWRYCNQEYRHLDLISHRLCNFIEAYESMAIPIYSCYPWKIKDRESFWGVLPLIYWAEEAGIGRLAKCGLLITPQYGTRILLGGIITTLNLEPDERLTDEICPSDCFKCIEICPINAITKTGKVDHNKCIRHSGANPLLALALKNPRIKQKFSFETLVNTTGVDDHGAYLCSECLKACPFNRE